MKINNKIKASDSEDYTPNSWWVDSDGYLFFHPADSDFMCLVNEHEGEMCDIEDLPVLKQVDVEITVKEL